MLRSRPSLVLAVLCAATACGPLRRNGPPAALVLFSNESLDQADVFLVSQSGAQVRIGTVMPGRRDTLRISAGRLGSAGTVDIVARLLASQRAPRTGPVTLQQGDRVQVTLPADQRMLVFLPARQ